MKKKTYSEKSGEQDQKIQYVLGFMFSADLQDVLLIRKQRPDWQRGRLNGIGGKAGLENIYMAMAREFNEEACSSLAKIPRATAVDWELFCELTDAKARFCVHCFHATSRLYLNQYSGTSEEPVEHYDVGTLPESLVPNCRWLIPMALTHFIHRGPVCRVIEL